MSEITLENVVERLSRLEMLSDQRKSSFELEVRGALQALHGRLQGLHTELSFMTLKLDRLQAVEDRLERLDVFLHKKLNGSNRD